MTRMKQFGLAAPFVVASALFTSSRALADDWATIDLTNTVNARDRDYRATGQATMTGHVTHQVFAGSGAWDIFEGELTVAYQGLTPGSTYRIGTSVWIIDWLSVNKKYYDNYYSHFNASATGSGEVTLPVSFVAGIWWFEPCIGEGCWGYWHYLGPSGYSFTVARKQGTKYIDVLYGYFPPHPYPPFTPY